MNASKVSAMLIAVPYAGISVDAPLGSKQAGQIGVRIEIGLRKGLWRGRCQGQNLTSLHGPGVIGDVCMPYSQGSPVSVL